MTRGGALYTSQDEKVAIRAANLLAQHAGIQKVVDGLDSSFRLAPEHIKEQHRLAMQGLYSCAGQYRNRLRIPRRRSVGISGSQHKPPEDDYVEGLVEDLCETVNAVIAENPVRAAAMVLRSRRHSRQILQQQIDR